MSRRSPHLSLDLNLLSALDALLTQRSVTRAAQRHGVGQPAMSTSLARLRRHFDDPLLVRDGRGMALTPLAERLIGPVDEAIRAIDSALQTSQTFDPAVDERTFTVAASDYVLVTMLQPFISALMDEAPRVQLSVEQLGTDYDDLLRRERVDLVITPSEVIPAGFDYPGELLFSDRYILAVDRDNTALGDALTIDEFASLRYVSFTSSPNAHIDRALDEAGVKREIVISTQSFVAVPLLVKDTSLACLVQERLATRVADTSHLRTLDLPLEVAPIHEWVYWHPRAETDPGHRWLRKRILDFAME